MVLGRGAEGNMKVKFSENEKGKQNMLFWIDVLLPNWIKSTLSKVKYYCCKFHYHFILSELCFEKIN